MNRIGQCSFIAEISALYNSELAERIDWRGDQQK
jgi:hypothetical protein